MKKIRIKLKNDSTIPADKKRKLSKTLNEISEIDQEILNLQEKRKTLFNNLDHEMADLRISRYETAKAAAEYVFKMGNRVSQIDPLAFHNICPDDMTFYNCIKVQITEARKKISQKDLEEITVVKPAGKKPPELIITSKTPKK